MSGKLAFGTTYGNCGPSRIDSSRAYCEGAVHRAAGTAIEKPITDNPHVTGSPEETAWDAGWTVADDAAGGALGVTGNCAYIGTISA